MCDSLQIGLLWCEVTGPINKPGFPRHRINLNNPPGKKKTEAILSKVIGPNNDTGKR